MKVLYIDCTNGVCADMLLSGLRGFGAETAEDFEAEMRALIHRIVEHGEYGGDHTHDAHSHSHDSQMHTHEHEHAGCEDTHDAHSHSHDSQMHTHEHEHAGCENRHDAHGDRAHMHDSHTHTYEHEHAGCEDTHDVHGDCAHSHDSQMHTHEHEHAGCAHTHDEHGASYRAVREVLLRAPLADGARLAAQRIYETIAVAEAEVHGATMETVHFHEVGRADAIVNIAAFASLLDAMGIERIVCSEVHDGRGVIECSHGVIPVPVPAVRAMMKRCDYVFRTEEVDTEMVTPSGLAMLIGAGAVCAPRPQGTLLAESTGYGTRDTGRDGMKLYLLESANA